MKKTFEIEIPVLWENKDRLKLLDLGIESSYEEETKLMTFYKISGIGIYENEGKEYGTILSNGSEFLTPISYKDLKDKIKIIQSQEEHNNE